MFCANCGVKLQEGAVFCSGCGKKSGVSTATKFEEKILKCKDCGADFIFSTDEQEFYADRNYSGEPKRCKSCQDARKVNETTRDKEIKSITCEKCKTKNLMLGGNHAYEGGLICKSCGKNYSVDERISLEAMEAANGNELFLRYRSVCSSCGLETRLPFKPKADKLVLCKDCFAKDSNKKK